MTSAQRTIGAAYKDVTHLAAERYRAMLWDERVKWFSRGVVIMAFAAYIFV